MRSTWFPILLVVIDTIVVVFCKQPGLHKDQSADWPNIASKPIDFPLGPYIDTFSEQQPKYVPFKPLVDVIVKKN